jgi:exoribonuclease II
MADPIFTILTGALVLYRGLPARVARSADKLELELKSGETVRVRPKDVELLHPGPLERFSELAPLPGEMHAAWEVLAGSVTSLPELAELAFGKYTPASAWATWQFLKDGLYFTGTIQEIRAATPEEVEQRNQIRQNQASEEKNWADFLERMRHGDFASGDERYLKEIEPLAYGATGRSRALRDLGKQETPENAHALLLGCGYWSEQVNPYPRRMGMPSAAPQISVPALPDEVRLDLTHLAAYAVDDEGTDNPDDAFSLEGERIWVHIADPAALAPPESALDLEARARGSTLHLPEGAIHLFPDEITLSLGLGLQATSPALSFGLRLGAEGEVLDLKIAPSWIKVERLTYARANERIEEPVFQQLEAFALLRRKRRVSLGAVDINLPEVRLRVDNGKVEIHPVENLRSRVIVEEMMILVGEAAAQYAAEHAIPLPFNHQEKPDDGMPTLTGDSMAAAFATRRFLHRSQYRTFAGPHHGLGVPVYAQATSPLRRYLDLVVHQQLRRHLRGERTLGESELMERIGAVEAVSGALRQAEVLSEKHWTLVYLMHHPGWQGEGVLVDKRGPMATLILPELALETRVHLQGDFPPDTRFQLEVDSIQLPTLYVNWAVKRI